MKRGDKFNHAKWLDENNKPLLCEVTAVRNEHIYWKPIGGRKAKDCFPISDTQKYARLIEGAP